MRHHLGGERGREDGGRQVHHGLHLPDLGGRRQGRPRQECRQVLQSSAGGLWECQDSEEQQLLQVREICGDPVQRRSAHRRKNIKLLVGKIPSDQPEPRGEKFPHLLPTVQRGRSEPERQLWDH